jgi:hypothetical protein
VAEVLDLVFRVGSVELTRGKTILLPVTLP